MSSTANHTIHKQTLEIRFNNFTTAHKWDTANQAMTAEAVRRSIERCFGDYDSVKEYLTINRIELDLGAFSADQVLSKMPEKLYRELQKILSSARIDLNDLAQDKIAEEVSSVNIWSSPVEGRRIADPIVKHSETTIFLFFLHYGYLPWWCSRKPEWNPEWLQKLTGEDWRQLRNFLADYQATEVSYEYTLSRLTSQFSDGFLSNLLNGLQLKEPVEKAWTWLTRFYQLLQKTGTDSFRNENSFPSLTVVRRQFWKKWIMYAVGRSAMPALATLFAPVKRNSLRNYFLTGLTEKKEWMDNLPECWHDELINLKQDQHPGKPELSVSNEFVNHSVSEKSKEAERAEHSIEEDFILIPDAGLVLLHPFLPQLFEHCNLLTEKNFVNDEARTRAVYALHYLAAGDEEAPEFVLMLPKLLCGIPLEWPLEPVALTEAEKSACDEMLVKVIGHWSALRNTSIGTLRETFLCRQGKLFSKKEGWRLEVQRKTEDILLDRLQWGFSMIKLSWMHGLLSVSWE